MEKLNGNDRGESEKNGIKEKKKAKKEKEQKEKGCRV